MSAAVKKELHLEIAHVLFMDVVGFSKLLINEQSEILEQLNQLVREAPHFREADAAGKLIRLATGDGMALVFSNTAEAPVECALEIGKALKSYPHIRLRMGVHSGPINAVRDVNDRLNVTGAGINLAQRVMDCGDAGHILLSKRVAEDLELYEQWRPLLHDLGTCEVKHGTRVGVVNLHSDKVGNPQLPKKFRALKRYSTRIRWAAMTAAVLALAAIVAGVAMFSHSRMRSTVAAPEKSIAVLPFANLSRDPDNIYFAEGIQDETLTRLAEIADLKVISRTSTQRFKSSPDDLPQIAKQLGVANVLEGSVQRSANQVRVNVQLINALSDAHVWAHVYDRDLTDVFAVETDISESIAHKLKAKLTGTEEQEISQRPTASSEAHEFYLKGRFFWNKRTANDLKTAISYFQQAIDRDPNYALAYAGLADSYGLLSGHGGASPEESFPSARTAAKKALALDDSLAEAHASLAHVLWEYDFDLDGSIREFRRAIELNPNYAMAHQWFGNGPLVQSGQFDDGIAEGNRAVELDPLSLVINTDLGNNYYFARRYDEAIEQLRKTLKMDPSFYYARYNLGQALEARGNLNTAIEEYQKARALNDDPLVLGLLGHAYASSGNKTEAVKILDQLKELSKQRYVPAYSFAIVYLGLSDKEEALGWLEKSYQDRAGFDIASIKVDPFLDPLRGDPRFDALAEKIIPRGAK